MLLLSIKDLHFEYESQMACDVTIFSNASPEVVKLFILNLNSTHQACSGLRTSGSVNKDRHWSRVMVVFSGGKKIVLSN